MLQMICLSADISVMFGALTRRRWTAEVATNAAVTWQGAIISAALVE